MNDKEKKKKIDNAMESIMRSKVNAKERDVETACVHNHPLDGFGEEYSPCVLHMSTNDFSHWLDHLVMDAVSRTSEI